MDDQLGHNRNRISSGNFHSNSTSFSKMQWSDWLLCMQNTCYKYAAWKVRKDYVIVRVYPVFSGHI